MYNFPNSPTIGQIVNFPSSSQQYIWDGQAWTGAPMSAEFVTGSGGSSVSASHALFADNSLNAIYAQTASLALNFFTSSVTNATSASHALNADNALNAISASFAITASYSIVNFVTSSVTSSLSSSYSDTASYVNITGSGILVNYNGSQIQLTGSTGGIIVSSSIPGPRDQGVLWFNSNDGNTYLQYIGPSGNTWIPAATSVGQAFSSSFSVSSSYAVTASNVITASYARSSSLSDSNTVYFLQATSNASYTLPGGYTDDPCRYNSVATAINVPSSWFNIASYRFTPQKAGYWQITACYDIFRGSNLAETIISMGKNGITQEASAAGLGGINFTITKIVYLNGITDYIRIDNSGNTAQLRTQSPGKSYFQARWIGI